MLPTVTEMFLASTAGLAVAILGNLIEREFKKLGKIVQIVLGSIIVVYVFYTFRMEGFIYFALLTNGYLVITFLTVGKNKAIEMKETLQEIDAEEVSLQRDTKRLIEENAITLAILSGSMLFLLFGPDHSIFKFLIFIGILSFTPEIIKRLFIIKTIRSYFSKTDNTLHIVSRYESRVYSVDDMDYVSLESMADALKLHPFLTLFSSKVDFTTSAKEVLHIRLPGEDAYLTPSNVDYWYHVLESNRTQSNEEDVETGDKIQVLPFYHRKNIKRLIGKLYFATTVKGISAYTTLLLGMYFLNSPPWLMVLAGLSFWLFNLYISDRVLAIAMDAKEIPAGKVQEVAVRVCQRAGIANVRVYETDSTEYNGLATGMNIGRSMVTLTTATLKLPIETIEGIIAHEVIHVKKRDVLWGQMFRLAYIFVMIGVILGIQYGITDIEAYTIPIFLLIWFLIIFFSIYQSFCSQWMEVRADHLGATLLDRKNEQMSESLTVLAIHQDEAMQKVSQYQATEEEQKTSIGKGSSLERGKWYWRLLEFQFMPHPPMYWRIHALKHYRYGWSRKLLRKWVVDRMSESIGK